MSRRRLELEILEAEFVHFTPEVRNHIAHLVHSERCGDTSDIVINGLWESCRDEMIAILDRLTPSTYLAVQDNNGQLPYESGELIRSYIDRALNREADLGDLDADKFENTYKAVFAPLVQAKRERRAQSARENDRWAFFNQLDADADFKRWRERLLTPEQAAALSFGKDPDVVTPDSLEPYRRVARSPFREAFKDRLDLIEAAVAVGELSVPMSVNAFATWSKANGLILPRELYGEAIREDAAYWKEKYETAQSALNNLQKNVDHMSRKSRSSIYMMIIGMAVARFQHKTVGNSKATSAIKSALEDINLKIDDDTILGHLRDAAGLLDVKHPEEIPWSGIRRPKS